MIDRTSLTPTFLLARARRRLKAVERSGSVPEVDSLPNDDRIRELELKVEQLRTESERGGKFKPR